MPLDKRIHEETFNLWVASRPRAVRELIMRFPPGTKFTLHGKIVHVMSYDEHGGVGVSEIDPFEDHEAAVAARKPVCACCINHLNELRV